LLTPVSMTATTAPLPLPRFHAVGPPICLKCHWYLKQASFGNALPGAGAALHSASIAPLAAAKASSNETFSPGADVWLRDRAAPDVPEHNVTERVTGGTWDVRDLDASYDGTKLIFSMRMPLIPGADDEDQPPFWRLVDRLAGLADRPERELALVADLLAIVVPRRVPQVGYRRRGR